MAATVKHEATAAMGCCKKAILGFRDFILRGNVVRMPRPGICMSPLTTAWPRSAPMRQTAFACRSTWPSPSSSVPPSLRLSRPWCAIGGHYMHTLLHAMIVPHMPEPHMHKCSPRCDRSCWASGGRHPDAPDRGHLRRQRFQCAHLHRPQLQIPHRRLHQQCAPAPASLGRTPCMRMPYFEMLLLSARSPMMHGEDCDAHAAGDHLHRGGPGHLLLRCHACPGCHEQVLREPPQPHIDPQLSCVPEQECAQWPAGFPVTHQGLLRCGGLDESGDYEI